MDTIPLIYQQVLPGFEEWMIYTVNQPPTLINMQAGQAKPYTTVARTPVREQVMTGSSYRDLHLG